MGRPYRHRLLRGQRARFAEFCRRDDAAQLARKLDGMLYDLSAHLDRDPNGYTIAGRGRILARCPNLDAVAAWIDAELERIHG